jgi:spermidine synthase
MRVCALCAARRSLRGRTHLGTVSGGDNHIAFAFADSGYPPDWARQEERAEALAEQFPPDFTAIVKRLREGAGRGGQKVACREGHATTKNKEFQTCRNQTRRKY